jgi:hypothetical protein
MSRVAIKGADTGTGVFTLESPATNTDRTLVLPDEAGTVLTSASTTVLPKGGPAFSVSNGSSQALTAGVFTKAALTTEEFDTNSCFDAVTNYRFTPNIAGYYQFNGRFYYGSGSSFEQIILLYKNGSAWGTYIADVIPASSREVNGSRLIYLNGTTDYIEMYIYINSSITVSVGELQFQGFLARAE